MSMTSERLIAQTAEIVSAYVAHNPVPASALPNMLTAVHEALCALENGSPSSYPNAKPTQAEIRASIRHDAIISFEDGRPYKALRRHLTVRGISPEAYRTKWGLPVDYPLVSAAYSAQRTEISKMIVQGTRRGHMQLEAAE